MTMGSIWADPEDDVKGAKIPSDPNLSPVDHLLARMRDPTTDRLDARDRIAIALLPFFAPKLQATAHFDGKEFASILDRRVAHWKKIEGQPRKPTPPVDVKPPLPHVYDKRYRRV